MNENSKEPVIRLVDDDERWLKALSFMLETEGWRVRAFRSAKEFLTGDRPSELGCVILDVRMPGMTGLQLQREMIARGIDLPIIFLSGHGDIEMAVETMQAGAFTFLQKTVSDEKLLQAIAASVEKNRLKRCPPFDMAEAKSLVASLSRREREVLEFAVMGLLNRDIACELDISERTVEAHRLSLYKKLRLKSAAELMNFYQRLHSAS